MRRDISADIFQMTETVSTAVPNQFVSFIPGKQGVGAFTRIFGFATTSGTGDVTITLGNSLTTICSVQCTAYFGFNPLSIQPISTTGSPITDITFKSRLISTGLSVSATFFYDIIGIQ